MTFSIKKLRKDALSIFQSALKAADPFEAVQREVILHGDHLIIGNHRYHLKNFNNIFVIGAGKGSARMAQAMEKILGSRITEGLIVVKYGYTAPLRKIKVHEAAHPIPDRRGLSGANKIIRLVGRAAEKDLIINLVSGGGSALLPSPQKGILLKDKQRFTDLLLRCGATITEINAIRKHLSRLKGGRLARKAYPSTIISLILSDIIGDPVDSIASGPTSPDSTTYSGCLEILKKYQILKKTPSSVLKILRNGEKGRIEETPKKDDPCFTRTSNFIVGNNFKSLEAALLKAKRMGYRALILSSMMKGETREAALAHSAILREILHSGNPVKSPACLISGGETTVTIHGKGYGGRNQEFVLAAALDMEEIRNSVVLCAGTDGTDGPTDAAGAIADNLTVSRARKLQMDPQRYLDNNDSYPFFKRLNDLIMTGPTNTNVMDVRILLADKPRTGK
jgi:hydroxypyruvate reductase